MSSTKRRTSWVNVNLRQSLRLGAWDVLSLKEDDHLSLLSSELIWTLVLQHSLRFGDRIVARSWWVVAPTIGLVALLVTMPKELLLLCPISLLQ